MVKYTELFGWIDGKPNLFFSTDGVKNFNM